MPASTDGSLARQLDKSQFVAPNLLRPLVPSLPCSCCQVTEDTRLTQDRGTNESGCGLFLDSRVDRLKKISSLMGA